MFEDLEGANQVVDAIVDGREITQHLTTPQRVEPRAGNAAGLRVRFDAHIINTSGKPGAEGALSCAHLHHRPRGGHGERATNCPEP